MAAMLRLIRSSSFICLLMAISSMAQSPPVLDTDGNPLTRGVEYYVDPGITDVASGLTLVARNGSCASYVGQAPIGNGSTEGLPLPRTVFENTTWGIGEEDPETGRRFIVVGGEPAVFEIESDQSSGPYTIGWCPDCLNPPLCGRPRCGVAGILELNGTRFLTLDGPASPFRFRRA
ncbi:hypothetical protein OIU74_024213 [Salix koriyanagi]|uniref:Uncharacterized protein n=1 Tax=Salix koriyanagi TaxID=2511006 RepID=A0A9Q1A887_9ROSI|nr:hypothetical protein OIU74_024213 [Salix koriyanagi]